MSSTLSTKCHFWKNTWALAILLEHMQKKFEINQTKIKGGCHSGRKVVTHNSKSDLPLECGRMDEVVAGRCGSGQISRCPNDSSHGILCCELIVLE